MPLLKGDCPQDEQDARERAKILKIQRDNEARLERLSTGIRSNAVGHVDTAALRKKAAMDERAYDMQMREQAMMVERALALAEEEEKEIRDYSKAQIKKSWEKAIGERNIRKEQERQEKDVDWDKVGPSALTNFEGDNTNFHAIDKAKKDEMRRWVEERRAYDSANKDMDKEADAQYAAMMIAVDQIREETENEEIELKKYIERSVREHNAELSAQVKERRARERADEKSYNIESNPFVNEEKNLAMDSDGRIIQRDMFRGYTKAQERTIYMENQALIDERNRIRNQVDNSAKEFYIQTQNQLKALEDVQYEESCIRDAINEEYLAYLKQQQDERKQAAAEERRRAMEPNGTEFYSGFGRSCR